MSGLTPLRAFLGDRQLTQNMWDLLSTQEVCNFPAHEVAGTLLLWKLSAGDNIKWHHILFWKKIVKIIEEGWMSCFIKYKKWREKYDKLGYRNYMTYDLFTQDPNHFSVQSFRYC